MRRRVKNWLIYHLARAAIGLAGLVPDRLTVRAGLLVGLAAHALAGRERRLARRQISLALDMPETGRRAHRLARGVFVRLGQSAVELCRLRRPGSEPPPVEITPGSRRALDDALAAGRGAVFVTGHIGNWELMALTLAAAGYPITTVAKESYDERFTRLIERFRERRGVRPIYRGRPGSSAAMLRALKSGRVLGLLIDQDTRVPGTFVPFFGREAYTPIGAAALALRSEAPVVVGSIRRVAGGRHVIQIAPCPLPDDVTSATALLTARLEDRIRRHPSQWVWFHRRWRTRPDEEEAA